MVEYNKKSNKYWEDLGEKGEIENEISIEIENLKVKYIEKLTPEIINSNESERLLLEDIIKDIDNILGKHKSLTDKEKQHKKNAFKLKFEEFFLLISKKKAYCKITFSAYPLYKFLMAFSSIINEVIFRVKKNGLSTVCIDKSRDSLINLEINNKNYLFLREGEIGININDLASIMKCNASDNSTAELIFGENIIYITIISKKFKSVVKRTLSTIDLEEDISMENFKKIQFISHFSLSKNKINYLIRNSELYSQNIQIRVDEKRVCFKENNNMGKGKIIWEKDNLELLFIDFVAIQNELTNQNLEESEIKILEGIILQRECCSCHPGSFLSHIGKIINVLNKNDLINFQLREGSPIKIKIHLRSLGYSKIIFFVVPDLEE